MPVDARRISQTDALCSECGWVHVTACPHLPQPVEAPGFSAVAPEDTNHRGEPGPKRGDCIECGRPLNTYEWATCRLCYRMGPTWAEEERSVWP